MGKHVEADGIERKHWRFKSFRLSGPQLDWIKSNGGGARLRELVDAARLGNLFAGTPQPNATVSPAKRGRRVTARKVHASH